MSRSAHFSFHGCSGSSTAGLASGGYPPGSGGGDAITEDWNGVSWVEVADLNTGRSYHMGNGTNLSALAVGGTPDGSSNTAATEEWSQGTTVRSVDTD